MWTKRRKWKETKLFLPDEPHQYVCIYILGCLPKTSQRIEFFVVITDRCKKLTKTIPTQKLNTSEVVRIFLKHCLVDCGIISELRSDSGPQSVWRFILAVFIILGVTNIITNAYLPQKMTRRGELTLRFCHDLINTCPSIKQLGNIFVANKISIQRKSRHM